MSSSRVSSPRRSRRANDFVSLVDKGSERAIIDLLSTEFPAHAFIAEETGSSGTSECVWLIDPLDGTTNFLHGLPHYCVSIGLKLGDQVKVAVTLDPVSDRLFTATRGGGAWLNGERISVSNRTSLS